MNGYEKRVHAKKPDKVGRKRAMGVSFELGRKRFVLEQHG